MQQRRVHGNRYVGILWQLDRSGRINHPLSATPIVHLDHMKLLFPAAIYAIRIVNANEAALDLLRPERVNGLERAMRAVRPARAVAQR